MLASVRRCGYTIAMAGSSGQLAANGRAVSVHGALRGEQPALCVHGDRTGPKLSFTNTYSLPFTSSRRIVSVCSCANAARHRRRPTIPSRFEVAQISSHFASARDDAGIAVTTGGSFARQE
jgi:hypothetical protein